jgi:hypothetical protein
MLTEPRRRAIIPSVRRLLAGLLTVACIGALGVGSARAEALTTTIGTSQGAEPLVVYRLGTADKRVLVLGGQHGGPERNTVELAQAILDYFIGNPEALPIGIGLDVMPVANPDGINIGSRQFLSGVDPNRNWGGADWRADAYDSNARFSEGLGGPEPFSEQETRALADWVVATKPALVINYHSAGGFMFGPRDGLPGELAQTYAEVSGYAWPGGRGPTGGGGSPLTYRASGSMNVWLRNYGIPGILVELSTPWYPEIERNLAALQAVLHQLSEHAT